MTLDKGWYGVGELVMRRALPNGGAAAGTDSVAVAVVAMDVTEGTASNGGATEGATTSAGAGAVEVTETGTSQRGAPGPDGSVWAGPNAPGRRFSNWYMRRPRYVPPSFNFWLPTNAPPPKPYLDANIVGVLTGRATSTGCDDGDRSRSFHGATGTVIVVPRIAEEEANAM